MAERSVSTDDEPSTMFNEIFTSYPDSLSDQAIVTNIATSTTTSSADDDNDSETSTIRQLYQVRTLHMDNIARLAVLPIYPPFSLSSPITTSSRTPHLLLANVPSKLFNK